MDSPHYHISHLDIHFVAVASHSPIIQHRQLPLLHQIHHLGFSRKQSENHNINIERDYNIVRIRKPGIVPFFCQFQFRVVSILH